MRYYPPVLVVLRFTAIVIMIFFLYRLVDTWLTIFPGTDTEPNAMKEIMRFQRDQMMMKSLITVAAGAVLYGVAPYLARLIVWGADRKNFDT